MAYNHKEAFCLMWYMCTCGHRERMWNSRDGVTPYGDVFCPSCGSDQVNIKDGFPGMSHTHFSSDVCVPDYTPHPGQQVWRNGTKAEAKTILEQRFALFNKRRHPVPEDIKESMLRDLHDPNCAACKGKGNFWEGGPACSCLNPTNSEFPPGWPMHERTKETT